LASFRHPPSIRTASNHVECGGLPPLSAARAFPGVLLAFAYANKSGDAISTASAGAHEIRRRDAGATHPASRDGFSS